MLLDAIEIYNLISQSSENVNIRNRSCQLRQTLLATAVREENFVKLNQQLNQLKTGLSKRASNLALRQETHALRYAMFSSVLSGGFTKLAFDTRRINQETEYNPRRGLQNYNRSDKFLSDNIVNKIQAYTKLAELLNQLKVEYGREPEWQDSYTRILTAAVDNGLRTVQADGDFSDCQPSIGSLDYLDELIYVRYRLTTDGIMGMSEENLRKSILSKDDQLVRQGISNTMGFSNANTPPDMSKNNYDGMVEKMLATLAQVMTSYKPPMPDDNLTSKLFDIKATKDSPEVERTVTITIKDKMVNELNKTGLEPTINKKVAIKDTDDNAEIEELRVIEKGE